MPYFNYGEKEMAHLRDQDPILGAYIDQKGMIYRKTNPDLFAALVESIVSQQISSKAAQTVCLKLNTLVGELTPANVIKYSIEELQKCGMSLRKASYIFDLAQKIITNEFDLEHVRELSDEEVIKKLITLKGIGPWTAEMLMIFSLERTNVLSYNDLAIQRGLRLLYEMTEITTDEFRKIKDRYSPYASIASLYLWDLASNTNSK